MTKAEPLIVSNDFIASLLYEPHVSEELMDALQTVKSLNGLAFELNLKYAIDRCTAPVVAVLKETSRLEHGFLSNLSR